MSTKANLLIYLQKKNVSKPDFYKKTGLPNGFLDKSDSVNSRNLEKLLSSFEDLSADWLISGRGEMLRNQNVQIFSNTSPANAPQSVENHGKNTQNIIQNKIPLYNAEAAAGFGSFSEMLTDAMIEEYYDIPDFRSADFLIHISGSSMAPKYINGDIVAVKIIHEPQFIQWGRPHVIATKEQGLLCKRLYESSLENHINVYSENPKYDPFDLPHDEILGFALVLGVIHRE